jgi:hypothetical protein
MTFIKGLVGCFVGIALALVVLALTTLGTDILSLPIFATLCGFGAVGAAIAALACDGNNTWGERMFACGLPTSAILGGMLFIAFRSEHMEMTAVGIVKLGVILILVGMGAGGGFAKLTGKKATNAR